ncbi:MAG: MFS transporter, partial [Stackebrandtia sp.]
SLMPVILAVQFVAFGGAMLMGWLAKIYGAKATVLAGLVLWIAIVVFAYFVPANNFGMLLALGMGIGLVLGGTQALSRSMFSQLIPKGKEGEYFGLYEISDRGTSWLGPILFFAAYESTGSYRIAILSLIVFFVLGFILLFFVPVRRAIVAVGNTPPAKV